MYNYKKRKEVSQKYKTDLCVINMVTSLKELYKILNPVFNSKIRIASYYGYNIKKIDMWKYLSINKWKYDNNLQLQEIVNDIITLEINKMLQVMGDSNEEK